LNLATRRPSSTVDTRIVYCGDCLDQLKELPSESVDLIYIDPPFNSNRNYEVFWGEAKEKRRFEDRHESTATYIEYMRPRCAELARVLKKTGSFYYHCDWHASHYVKVMLDQIFGESVFQNEIIWKRCSAHSDTKQGRRAYGNITDSLLYYTKTADYTFNTQFTPYSEDYLRTSYRNEDPDGRRWKSSDLTGPGGAAKGNPLFEFLGVKRYWRYTKENIERLHADGRIYQSKDGAVPRMKHYLDEMKGIPLQNLWDDIAPVQSRAGERRGYPTQKPLTLLERIIETSSNDNDIVLDAFCGCGTALEAAQTSGRQWIGIDVSPTACRVMSKRLRDKCKLKEDEKLWRLGRGFVVRDLPWTEANLRKMPPFEFENWAVIALGGMKNAVQVGDMGIDGRIYPMSNSPAEGRTSNNQDFAFMDQWYPIQVKQKDKAGRPDIDQFETAMMREKRTKGFFVSFDFTSDAMTEINRWFRSTGNVMVPFTVKDILEDRLAQRLC
jgi:DNA modification methylase